MDQRCRCKHECPWMILGPYDGVEEPPCDTSSFISHTRLPLINQVRGPFLTYGNKESVSKSHLGRWQLKCDFGLWQYSILFSEIRFIFLWLEKKNYRKDYGLWSPCNTMRVKIRRPALPSSVAFHCSVEKYAVTSWQLSYKSCPKNRGFQRVTKDQTDKLSIDHKLKRNYSVSVESLGTLTPCFYNKWRLIFWSQRVRQCGHYSICSSCQLTQNSWCAICSRWNIKHIFNLSKKCNWLWHFIKEPCC